MNRVKVVFPLFVFVGTLISAPVMANCAGNVYSMNAGRGHVGLLLDLQEREKMKDIYTDAQERTFFRSKGTHQTGVTINKIPLQPESITKPLN